MPKTKLRDKVRTGKYSYQAIMIVKFHMEVMFCVIWPCHGEGQIVQLLLMFSSKVLRQKES